MRPAFSLPVRQLLPLAAVLLGLASVPAVAGEMQPPAVQVDRPLYQANASGLQKFVEDDLAKLVVGQKWSWRGQEFEVVRLHRIDFSRLTQAPQANRDYGAPVRGMAVAIIHVKVDGRLRRARIEANASYVWQPAGWAWEQALLYLGGVDSWDFVTRQTM